MNQSQLGLQSDPQVGQEESLDDQKFILFKVNKELYGTRLLEVREVVEKLPTKPVPNTVGAFLGVCNLRGQIIGVIDLRQRFGVDPEPSGRPVLLVFETEMGGIATSVDQIVSVTVIPKADIETNVSIATMVPNKFIIGVGKVTDQLVTLLDLKSILSSDELTNIKLSKIHSGQVA